MSFLAVAAISSVVFGAKSVVDRNRGNQRAKGQMNKQLTTAQEAAKLKKTKQDAGAKVKVGAADSTDTEKKKKSALGKKAVSTSGGVVGGVSASKIGGL
jgi:hypothetical protein